MTTPSLQFEQAAWQQGFRGVVGVDEVGRGCWAGPVVAGAVILSPTFDLGTAPIIRDSKTLSAKQRQIAVDFLAQSPDTQSAIGQASVEEINSLGIAPATFLAMQRAIEQLPADYLLIDAFQHPSSPLPQQAIVKGDSLSVSIAAASIVAKQYRDQLMATLSHDYPQYGFDQHVGYGTRLHQQAIQEHGLSPLHRQFNLKFLNKA